MPTCPPTLSRQLRIWLLRSTALLALLAVFGLYLEPEFMRTMADQIWACF